MNDKTIPPKDMLFYKSFLTSIDVFISYKLNTTLIPGELTIYDEVACYDTGAILTILNSKTNVPSVHDLGIINACGSNVINKTIFTTDVYNMIMQNRKDILEFYKKRKV